MRTSIDLRLPLEGVTDLARHAATASSHRAPYGTDAVAALTWVYDDGTYLSSSGLPIQPRADGAPAARSCAHRRRLRTVGSYRRTSSPRNRSLGDHAEY